MIPSTLWGLLLFVALLAPGLAHVLRHERIVPTGPRSALRETLRVVFISVLCLVTTGLLLTLVRALIPDHTPNVRGLVRAPVEFARQHHVHLAWWAFGCFAFATALGFFASDPRLVRG
ncbi:DUF6338 family protein, partial [Actinoplanes sp. NPDC051633]|uniref:DUF6338 family protein n=1 Tax=Actinoplanes sp. NPDC051633 TaxID=3155670 RepID=UPI003420E0C2